MTERQLECFLSLARTLNFSLTAKELYLSQPAVSQQIRALETDLGSELFTRGRKGVTLTSAGLALYAEAEEYLAYSRSLARRVREKSPLYTARLDFAYSVALRLLPEILQRFHAQRPHTLIHFSGSGDFNRSRQILCGPCDVGACFGDLTQDFGDFRFTELYSGGFVCILADSHPLAGKSHIRAEDLRGETLFALSDTLSDSVIRRLNNFLMERREIREVYATNKFGEAALLAEAGFGVAVLPRVFFEPHPGSVHIPFDYFEQYHIGLFSRSDAGADAEAFCRIARELCREDTGSPLIG